MGIENFEYRSEWESLTKAEDQRRNDEVRNMTNLSANLSRDSIAASVLGVYKRKIFLHRRRQEYDAIWGSLSDQEAAELYLINKHHWLPDRVKGIGNLDFVLRQELQELFLSDEEYAPIAEYLKDSRRADLIQKASQPPRPSEPDSPAPN